MIKRRSFLALLGLSAAAPTIVHETPQDLGLEHVVIDEDDVFPLEPYNEISTLKPEDVPFLMSMKSR